MKKALLLIASGIVALSAGAQERTISLTGTPEMSSYDYRAVKEAINQKTTAAKTTADDRWYSYVDYFDINETAFSSSIALAAPYLWKDTMAVMAYSATGGGTTWQHNRTVSLGLVADPAYAGFNNFDYFPGLMKVTSTNAYAVDSIRFFGRYGTNPLKLSIVDTIRVAFVYGNGETAADIYQVNTTNPSVLSNYGLASTDVLSNHRMRFDSNTTRANGSTVVVKDILLNSTTHGDTLSNGTFVGAVSVGAVGTGVAIPAGNLIGASLTFISGDPDFVAHDTVFGSTLGYKYNMFRPYVGYKGTTTTPQFATYSPLDRNNGMFKTLPDTALGWGGQFIPMWFWTASGGASTSQYPYIDFHIKCAACGVVTDVDRVNELTVITQTNAYPNPATGEVNVPFALSTASDVTVTLSNMLGQVVATSAFANTNKGKAVFNTAILPSGIYTYTVSAKGQKSTGRIAVVN
jgi:hypothetical protein